MLNVRGKFKGKRVVYKFPVDRPTQTRGLFLGAYPPKQANEHSPHKNKTCQRVISALGHDRFDFIDIFPISPDGNSSDIGYDKLMTNIDQSDVLDCDNRLKERVAEYERDAIPVINVCGPRVCDIFIIRMPSITDLKVIVPEVGIYSVKVGGRKCIVLMDQDHPSAHLMSRGEKGRRGRFKRDMNVLKLLLDGTDPSNYPVRRGRCSHRPGF